MPSHDLSIIVCKKILRNTANSKLLQLGPGQDLVGCLPGSAGREGNEILMGV